MRVVPLSKENEYSAILEAVITLKRGGLVVAPTDTVYGLCADARSSEAVDKIFTVKGRKKDNPIPVFIDSFEKLNDVAYISDSATKKFLEKIWPGKITCVLPSRGWMPIELRGQGKLNIGVRMPDYNFILSLIKSFGGSLTGTSANLSGREETNKISEVVSSFQHMPFKPDLIIDAGDLPESLPSTVLDCTVKPPKIIREGAVLYKKIEEYF
ncbi:MAG: threonylcarbamoyl-AMP synthase [Candidatus Tagabacteria bacterium RIFCSPLOWO2_01_FULL_39_11]|uniref:L-threonylcarbamoyladenylate synthase n=1 Tax=Candidatus Tagabacteria bacterium RIFCSPLOWO2_01_FULL_39_11 TaxID=1802295 RepID=A0A1G2LU63_9BACT|nr:MAG: threonylcarbamoyl-AMP synthase [Candidatus Tagabacteria bacterium RIFCSPLOWO2_01_FULL_39_11]